MSRCEFKSNILEVGYHSNIHGAVLEAKFAPLSAEKKVYSHPLISKRRAQLILIDKMYRQVEGLTNTNQGPPGLPPGDVSARCSKAPRFPGRPPGRTGLAAAERSRGRERVRKAARREA